MSWRSAFRYSRPRTRAARRIGLLLASVAAAWLSPWSAGAETALLNASYDPTRRFYTEINRAFAAEWQAETGDTLKIRQSHGGAGEKGPGGPFWALDHHAKPGMGHGTDATPPA